MMDAREELARFIQGQGHLVEASGLEPDAGELLFRTRGYVFSVSAHDENPPHFEIATAYEIPPWARERAQNATALQDVAGDAQGVHFSLAPNGKTFTVALASAADLQTFELAFWANVTRVREAGISALERILDRSESRAAADKFIKSLTKGR